MELSLGPTFADKPMSFMETKWLNECPPDFKSMHYRRYVEDSFYCLFIFTCKRENNRNLAF